MWESRPFGKGHLSHMNTRQAGVSAFVATTHARVRMMVVWKIPWECFR